MTPCPLRPQKRMTGVILGNTVGTFSERLLEPLKQSKAMSHYLPRCARVVPSTSSRSLSTQRSSRQHDRPATATSSAPGKESEPVVRSKGVKHFAARATPQQTFCHAPDRCGVRRKVLPSVSDKPKFKVAKCKVY